MTEMKVENNEVVVEEKEESYGFFRALLEGMIEGFINGWAISCKIVGIFTTITGAIVLIAAMFAPKEE